MRYLRKRNNPWELLPLASVIFVAGLGLLAQSRPVMLLNVGRTLAYPILLSPFAAHIWGAVAVLFSLFLVAIYIYALRSIARDEAAPPPRFLNSRD